MTAKGTPNYRLRTVTVEPGTIRGRLTVIGEERITLPDGRTTRGLLCECTPALGGCGRQLVVELMAFRHRGNTRSCGCLHKQVVADQARFMNAVLTGIPTAERKAFWAANRTSIAKDPDRAAQLLADAAQREHIGFVQSPEYAAALTVRRRAQRATARREAGTLPPLANARWERTMLPAGESVIDG